MDEFKIFIWLQYFFKWKRSDLRWAVGSIPILIIPNIQCIWSNGALKGSIENLHGVSFEIIQSIKEH